ncbi:Hint domain-containing protein [Mycoplana ramosa]|uniref:Hint domain-containing protein n=1 Tax=Mycoplana ramosa TaxID=40837 RepID=A0ABW3YVM0_MYCRA
MTTAGEIAVEDLKPGDCVRTAAGQTLAIKWIGRQTFRRSGRSWNRDIVPIRIARHALEDRTPHTDLYVSAYHALLVDGVLIRAKDLINGTTIAPVLPEGRATIEYFHILLDRHDVVLAQGAPAETFLAEAGNHEMFSNFAELARHIPDGAPTMKPFAPIMQRRGRDHLNALLQLARHPFAAKSDPIEEVRERLAHRARAFAV